MERLGSTVGHGCNAKCSAHKLSAGRIKAVESSSQHTLINSSTLVSSSVTLFQTPATMKVQALILTALATAAFAFSLDDSPLNVEIEFTGNTAVKALIKNTGSGDLKLFKTGTFLDDTHVEKVEVFKAGKAEEKVAFDGIRLCVSTNNLDESAFQILAAGKNIEASFDIAVAHNLSAGGDFDILTEGAFAYANLPGLSLSSATRSRPPSTAGKPARCAATTSSSQSAQSCSQTAPAPSAARPPPRCPTAHRWRAPPHQMRNSTTQR